MRKYLYILLVIITSLYSTNVYSATVNEPSGWAKEKVQQGTKADLVPERLQGNYRKAITRGEFAELMVNAVVFNEITDVDKDSEFYFEKEDILKGVQLDVEFVDAKEDYIKIAYILGIVNGITETEFMPNKTVTRQEAAVMMANTFQYGSKLQYMLDKYKDMDEVASWAKDAVGFCYANAFMRGSDGYFRPKDGITREEAIYMIDNIGLEVSINAGLRARGVVRLDRRYFDKQRFVVGKDYVYIRYADDTMGNYYLDYWKYYNGTNMYKNPTIDQTRVAYQCADIIYVAEDLLENIAIEQAKAKVSTEFMDAYFWQDDYLIKIDLSKKAGLFSRLNGPRYGNPSQPVTYTREY